MSKGSKQRPTNKDSFDANYESIFRKPVTKRPKDPAFVGSFDDMGQAIEEEPTNGEQE